MVVVLFREEPQMQNSESKLYVRTKKFFSVVFTVYVCSVGRSPVSKWNLLNHIN